MNSLKLNNKERNKIITKTTSLALASILIASMFVGLIPVVVMPAAAANTYLSVSSTKIGNTQAASSNNAIKITVNDPTLVTSPTVTLSSGTNVTDLRQEMVKTSTGDWVIFIASNETSLTALAVMPPGNGTNAISAANAAGAAIIRTVKLTNVADTANLTSLTVTYVNRGETETLTVGETTASSATTDRTEAPPNSKVYITVSDATTNLDPTAIDIKNYSIAVTVNLGVRAAPITMWMTETGVDTGLFRGILNMTGITAPVPVHGDLLQVAVTDDDSTAAVLVSVNVRATDGSLSTAGTLTYTTNLNVTLTDADRNLDTLAVETITNLTQVSQIPVLINATIGTFNYTSANLWLTETGKNTGVFLGTISVSISNTTTVTTTNSTAVTLSVAPGGTLSLYLKYVDPVKVTLNHYSEATGSLSKTAATI
ncbi:hypothetical protein ACFL96_18490 [Thermoproteota archaeon]